MVNVKFLKKAHALLKVVHVLKMSYIVSACKYCYGKVCNKSLHTDNLEVDMFKGDICGGLYEKTVKIDEILF